MVKIVATCSTLSTDSASKAKYLLAFGYAAEEPNGSRVIW